MKKKLIASLIIGIFLISGLSFVGCNKPDSSTAQTNTESDSNSKKDSTTEDNKIDSDQNKQESSKDSNKENSSSSEIPKKDNENAENSKDSKKANDSAISKEKSNKEDNSSKKTDSTSNDENKTNKNSNSDSEEKNLKYEYEEADKQLNELWDQIVSYGADYPYLIKSQKKWIKYKDSKDLATKTKLTQERITTLQKWFAYQMRIQGEKGYQFAQTHKCPSLDWE
ncbi:lysozyme inhibitor LprI family protein [Clostridium perfringens]|nr:lysozyme inhibitor LprI family protein [Clostridium perfringens]